MGNNKSKEEEKNQNLNSSILSSETLKNFKSSKYKIENLVKKNTQLNQTDRKIYYVIYFEFYNKTGFKIEKSYLIMSYLLKEDKLEDLEETLNCKITRIKRVASNKLIEENCLSSLNLKSKKNKNNEIKFYDTLDKDFINFNENEDKNEFKNKLRKRLKAKLKKKHEKENKKKLKRYEFINEKKENLRDVELLSEIELNENIKEENKYNYSQSSQKNLDKLIYENSLEIRVLKNKLKEKESIFFNFNNQENHAKQEEEIEDKIEFEDKNDLKIKKNKNYSYAIVDEEPSMKKNNGKEKIRTIVKKNTEMKLVKQVNLKINQKLKKKEEILNINEKKLEKLENDDIFDEISEKNIKWNENIYKKELNQKKQYKDYNSLYKSKIEEQEEEKERVVKKTLNELDIKKKKIPIITVTEKNNQNNTLFVAKEKNSEKITESYMLTNTLDEKVYVIKRSLNNVLLK